MNMPTHRFVLSYIPVDSQQQSLIIVAIYYFNWVIKKVILIKMSAGIPSFIVGGSSSFLVILSNA